jgi:hypothetical protein
VSRVLKQHVMFFGVEKILAGYHKNCFECIKELFVSIIKN